MKKHYVRDACVFACLSLTACGTIGSREDTAQDVATPAGLVRQDIPGAVFTLASWRKMNAPGAAVHVYIEGDGSSWISRSTPSMNPTPKNPLALKLAALDPAPNVVYIARPCQFTQIGAPGNECPPEYWMSARFAPEVIAAFDAALNGLSAAYGAPGYDLIGFSGGANVAGLLATRRSDILSLRTVAGNIDNDAFTTVHKVTPMTASLNMAANAPALANLPQIHFIGAEDKTVPPTIFESYRAKAGPSSCIQERVVSGATHLDGWEAQWPALLSEPVVCR